MNVHDDAFLDSIAVLALGALPEMEARALAAHLATCATCRATYAELRAAADLVGYGAEFAPSGLDEIAARRLKDRIMTAVVDSAAPTSTSQRAVTSVNGKGVRARTSWVPYGVAVAAALIAAISLADNASLRGERTKDAAQVASLRAAATRAALHETALTAELRSLDARVATIVAPGSRHFPVASGEVVTSGNRIVIALHDLPALPAGKVYQAWTLARGAKAVSPSLTFRPDAAGIALVALPDAAAGLAAVAVSVEPARGSKAPTTKPAFIRKLS